MARDVPAIQQMSSHGLAGAYTAVTANNDQVVNNGRRFVHVKNTGGGSLTVTVNIGQTFDTQAVAATTVTVPATTGDKVIGPFPSGYNQPDGTGNVFIDYSTTTGVTRAVYELPVV